MPHTEIPVKVNAWVDEGVAPLVLALNKLDGVCTLDSCECGPLGQAFVFFTYGQTWQELATLLQEVSSALCDPGIGCGYELEMRWLGTDTIPRAQALIRPEHVGLLADGLTQIADDLNRRMIRLVGDRRHKAPQRLRGCLARS